MINGDTNLYEDQRRGHGFGMCLGDREQEEETDKVLHAAHTHVHTQRERE